MDEISQLAGKGNEQGVVRPVWGDILIANFADANRTFLVGDSITDGLAADSVPEVLPAVLANISPRVDDILHRGPTAICFLVEQGEQGAPAGKLEFPRSGVGNIEVGCLQVEQVFKVEAGRTGALKPLATGYFVFPGAENVSQLGPNA